MDVLPLRTIVIAGVCIATMVFIAGRLLGFSDEVPLVGGVVAGIFGVVLLKRQRQQSLARDRDA